MRFVTTRRLAPARLVLMAVLTLDIGACQQASHSPAPVAAASQSSTGSGSEPVQSTARDGPTESRNDRRSLAMTLMALPPQDQSRIHDWYALMGGSPVGNATRAQIAWMQERHYPMPADILRAQSMSDQELKDAAETEGTLAQILYVARLLRNYDAAIRAGVEPRDVPDRLWTEVARLVPRILASGSAYAGYVFAASERIMHPGSDNSATELAGLVWASKRGDTRADLRLRTPGMNAVSAASAVVAVNGLMSEALRNNPQLFSMPVLPIPQGAP